MSTQQISPDSINSLYVLKTLSDELVDPYDGIQTYVAYVLGNADTLTNTINSLINQPDYLTYVSKEEAKYFTMLAEYLAIFIKNFPISPDPTD